MPDVERAYWQWRQWELIRVQHESDAIVLDALEPADNPAEASTELMTIEFRPTDPAGDLDGLVETLSDWVASDTPCGVLRCLEGPFGSLTLFQDLKILVFNTT